MLQSLPVRKETALKECSKTLAAIKRIIQSYAFARPSVRFHLRVPKARSNKFNFTYAPKKDANIEDVTLKIVGRSCALQCEWTTIESDGYDIRAFLPKPNAVDSEIANAGAFLSIDGRPLSTIRGTPKKIIAAFKEQFRKSNPSHRLIKDAFFFMNIICPPGSYDPNIEPAKDDILFEREDVVLAVVTKLLTAYYPEVAAANHMDEHPDSCVFVQTPISPQPSEVSSDHPGRSETIDSILEEVKPSPGKHQIVQNSLQWRSNMYGVDEDDLELLSSEYQRPVIEDDEEEGRRAVSVSNPWTIAKMNAFTKAKPSAKDPQLTTPIKTPASMIFNSKYPIAGKITCQQPPLEPPTPQTVSRVNTLLPPHNNLPDGGEHWIPEVLCTDNRVSKIVNTSYLF